MRTLATLVVISFYIALLSPNVKGKVPMITAWNYYLAPPFVESGRSGLAFDFVKLLNKELGNQFHFRLEIVPRARLNKYLKNRQKGIVLFVNWAWMGKNAKKKYLWTPRVLEDRNEIISLVTKKVVYKGPHSLKGLRFGAIRGRKYKELSTLMSSNVIKRRDLNNEKQIFRMLLANRIDVTRLPYSLTVALLKRIGKRNQFYFSHLPHLNNNRHILVTRELLNVHKALSSFCKKLESNPDWKIILNKYGLIKF
ncbi:MAG: polar amino acid transport system substrate-binding protein [bacterium]|jgi:polar amino acid transport system substrate-binding protein